MNFKEIQHKLDHVGDSSLYTYHNIPIFSTDGIHEAVFTSFIKSNIPKNAQILILGAGAGAFDQRLIDHGYHNIVSTELIPESYLAKGTKLIEFDLNNDFSHLGKFDCVVALEIIEHLENQFHFMRCVKSCLKDDGIFYLSTPNAENTFSRAKFYILGRLHFFGVGELYTTGHITPIFGHVLRFNLDHAGLKIEEYFTNGNVWFRMFRRITRETPLYLFFFLLSFLTINRNDFDINLYKITNK